MSQIAPELIPVADQQQTAYEFCIQHGRWPMLGDPVAPWQFKGWLLPMIQKCERVFYEDVPGLSEHLTAYMKKRHGIGRVTANRQGIGRWEYYLRMVERGGLIDEPIPQIHFTENIADNSPGLKMAWKLCQEIEYKWGYSAGLTEFITWLGFACGVHREPSKLTDDIQEALYRGFDASVWLNEPADYLGAMMSERKSGSRWNNPAAFFPTPDSLVAMMAKMVIGEAGELDRRAETVCDPCVGSGRMLLHAGGYSLRLYGMDIDPACCLMTRINGAFFCPWLAFGCPDEWFAGGTSITQSQPLLDEQPETIQFEPVRVTEFNKRGQGLLF